MPYGLIIDTLAVIAGAFIGVVFGKYIPDRMKESLTIFFGMICFTLGITLVIGVNSLVPVGVALVLGTATGEAFNLDGKLQSATKKLQNAIAERQGKNGDESAAAGVVTLLPLFCINTTIILGSINDAMGDYTVLLVKSVLDFFTAIVFAANFGLIISLLSVPLLLIGMVFFGLSSLLGPILTPAVVADLNACGGIHCMAVAFNVIGIKHIRVNNAIPALVYVVPLTILWGMVGL